MARTKKRRRKAHNRKALPRTPSGQLSRAAERQVIERVLIEHETRASLNELRNDRARGLGLTREQADDPISETIAGRMALGGLLTRLQAEAVNMYAGLVRSAMAAMQAPAGTRCSLNLKLIGERVDDPDSYAETMRRYNNAFGALRKEAGHRACLAINLVVRDFQPFPLSERGPARAGASALVRHFGLSEGERRKAA